MDALQQRLRRPLLHLLAVVAIAAVSLLLVGGTARAQITCCPSYKVILSCSLPACVFPLTVETCWKAGAINWSRTYTACGTIVDTRPVAPFCWEPPFCGVKINGGASIALGATVDINLPGCGCITVHPAAVNGCVQITIDPKTGPC